WYTLEYAVFWVFQGVAGADDNIDRNEEAALTKALHEAHDSPNTLARELWRAINADFGSVRDRYNADTRNITDGLKAVVAILKKKPSPEGDDFRKLLMQFGVDVARSSGGILGFGEKMSKVEREALEKIASLLEVTFTA